MSDDLWNAVVCFQQPSLLIGKVWVPVMHFCVPRVGRRLGTFRLISAHPLIGQPSGNSLKLCSVGIGGSVLSILTQFLSNQSQHVMVDCCQSKLVNVVSGVPQWFGPVIVPPVHLGALFHYSGYADDSSLIAVLSSRGIRVTVAESLSRDHVKVSEWCDL